MIAQFSIHALDSSHMAKDMEKMVAMLAADGLPFEVGPIGTVVEGTWDRVMSAIRQCHDYMIGKHDRVIMTVVLDDARMPTHTLADLAKTAERHGSRMPHGDMEVEC